jgi:hypothetical protein
MAIIIKTNDPADLLKAIKKSIDEGTIETWSYDTDGDFTHTPPQWFKKAWLRPKQYVGELRFGILGPKDTKLSAEIYGVYHGRFIEMLLTHFDNKFSIATATAKKTEPDIF